MSSVAATTLVLAGFLVLVSLVQPVATRLRLPYTVMLAIVGLVVGASSTFLLYSPAITIFDDIVRPVVELPFSAETFLDVFLPILLFHASLTIDVREIAQDAAPILTLAIVAVFAAAAAIGFSLYYATDVPLLVALLLGSIVATTDPAAVVAIMREVGAPLRLSRLLEGEALLNDAAAIVLFSVLVEMLASDAHPTVAVGAEHFLVEFIGGIVIGTVAGRLYGAVLPWLGGLRMAEVTLAVGMPYIVYLVGDTVLGVSGVVAVASAGLAAGVVGRVRLSPANWAYLEEVWEQLGFWASSLIFVTASSLVPKLLVGIIARDGWLLLVALGAALLSRAAVLFGLLPLLSLARLSQRVSAPYKLVIAWGGLRGAITLALALSVTENEHIDGAAKDLVAVLATGFVFFTLLVNGLTLRPVIRLLKLDRLSPLDQALRSKVLAVSLEDVRERVQETARDYAIEPAIAAAATERYSREIDALAAEADLEQAISDEDRAAVALIALANREHRIILDHHAQHTVSGAAIERLLRNTDRIIEGTKAEGSAGYTRTTQALLGFAREFRFANLLHREFHLARPLQRQISIRFEILLVRRLVLDELARFARGRLNTVFGERIAYRVGEIVAERTRGIVRALDALRLQYPEYAEALERRFLEQSGLRLLILRCRDLYDEGLIGRELFDELEREHAAGRLVAARQPALDLGLHTEELLGGFDMFACLEPTERRALARRFRPRLLVPGEIIIRKDERGTSMFLISSGAVEVVLPDKRIRLGSGAFVGEMALVTGERRTADVVALGYCRVLVLTTTEFRRFLREYPNAKEEIDAVVDARRRANAGEAREAWG